MKCLNCNQNIIVKRNLNNLFVFYREYICEKCFMAMEFKLNYILLPVNNHQIKVFYYFEEFVNNSDIVINESSKIYNLLYTKYNYIFVKPYIKLNDFLIETLEAMSYHFENDIAILCSFIL